MVAPAKAVLRARRERFQAVAPFRGPESHVGSRQPREFSSPYFAKMLTLRILRWPEEVTGLEALDTSFTTDRIYRVMRDGLSFILVEEEVSLPLRKEYGSISGLAEEGRSMEHAVVAEVAGVVVGVAATNYESWNRRLVVEHLYVAPAQRGSGVGRALIDYLDEIARTTGARCLWLETQNINYPAIQFYQRLGFRLCGLDESLYDPAGPGEGEIALYFTRDVA